MQRNLDIVFCALGEAAAGSDLWLTEFLPSFAVLVASPNHPLAAEKRISPERLIEFDYVGPRVPGFSVEEVLGVNVADAPGRSYNTNDLEAVAPLVEAGKATMFMPAFEAEPFVRSGAFVQLDLELNYRLSFVAATTRAGSVSPILNKLTRYAREIGEEMQRHQMALRP